VASSIEVVLLTAPSYCSKTETTPPEKGLLQSRCQEILALVPVPSSADILYRHITFSTSKSYMMGAAAVGGREGISSYPGSAGGTVSTGWEEEAGRHIPLLRGWLTKLLQWIWWNPVIQPRVVRLFSALQSLGISICPNHYYWPVPDVADLRSRDWPLVTPTPGLELNLEGQREFATNVVARYERECSFSSGPGTRISEYHYNNGLFECVDAEVAYAMVRHHKPKRVIEVGGGYSTRLIANALQRNAASDGKPGELITIEPFPEEALRNGFPGLSMLIADPAQKVDVNLFASLSEGDVLFVDSSHVVKTGSDVCYECLQILPRLKPGVLVHFHDIFLPCEYPRQAVLERLCFWSEQYLLQAFLAMNDGFEVLWAASAMQLFHPEVVESAIPRWRGSYTRMPPEIRRFQPTLDGDRVWPASFWMRRKPQPA